MRDDHNDNITTLRSHLFEAIRAVRAGTLDIDKARAINELSKTIVDTGKLEVDHIRATGDLRESPFIAPAIEGEHAPANGITAIVRHRLAG